MKRVIFLVDMNAFFISCEMARNPKLKGKPAAVAGDAENRSGIILTANYDARKYGVKTTMLIHEAKELCPNIIFVKPDHEYYRKKSIEVMNILSRYTPIIQQNSIDEAWMDVTGCDKLFGKPVEIAKKIMDDIINELDLWCSIGISENKFLSKMASEIKKPLGITEMWIDDIQEKMWPLPVRAMYGIGRQTEKRLADLAVYTIGDLAKCDKNLLYKIFGKYGYHLHMLANGIDTSPVTANPMHENKSISRSTTLKNDIVDINYAKRVLLKLSEEVGSEARKSGYWGKTVSIIIKYSDFMSVTRQKSISPTFLTKRIYDIGAELLEENWSNKPVRLIGIALGNLVEDYVEQVCLFDMSQRNDNNKKEEKLERAMDLIRDKFGHDKIKRASVLNKKANK